MLFIVLSRNSISLEIKIQGLDQQIDLPETLDLTRQNMIILMIIVSSRNSFSLDFKEKKLDQRKPAHRKLLIQLVKHNIN